MANTAGVNQTVISLAFNQVQPEITDNIFDLIPLLDYLRDRGQVKILDGGERISRPIMHAANSTAKSYSGYGIIDTTPQEGFGSVEYLWRQYAVSVTISGKEQRQVSGLPQIADILDAKKMQAEMSLAAQMNAHLFETQAGTNTDSLLDFIPDDPTSGTVGGINRATAGNEFWRTQTASGASSSTAFDTLLARMRSVYNSCVANSKKLGPPDFAVTDQTVFEGYEGLVDSNRQYGNEKLLNLGFFNLAFKTTGILFDLDCSVGDFYFMNSKAIELAVHKDAFFQTTDFVKPSNQDALVAQILFQGNMTMRHSQSNGVIHSIT